MLHTYFLKKFHSVAAKLKRFEFGAEISFPRGIFAPKYEMKSNSRSKKYEFITKKNEKITKKNTKTEIWYIKKS